MNWLKMLEIGSVVGKIDSAQFVKIAIGNSNNLQKLNIFLKFSLAN